MVRSTTHRCRPDFATNAWSALATGGSDPPPVFDPSTLRGLPTPAQRLLNRALPPGTPLWSLVELEMDGEIRLGKRWVRFTADQIIRAGLGFVWSPVVGGRIMRFVGADVLTADLARVEFRLHGHLPVARAEGPDTRRSARGRLAAETAAWMPQALTPQLGASWVGLDDERATVAITAAGESVDICMSIDERGHIRWLGLDRWKDSAEPPTHVPFGGSVHSTFLTAHGVRIAGTGTVGWDFHTAGEAAGTFFRYRIRSARFSGSFGPVAGVTPDCNVETTDHEGGPPR